MNNRLRWLLEIIVNFALPWLAYRYGAERWGETGGLMLSAAPPALWSLWELARFRRVDALSVLVLAGIALSAVAMLLGGDARMLLMRESLISGLVGVVFLLSLLAEKPLIYHLARATVRRESAENAARFEAQWQSGGLREMMRQMTLLWGLGLTLETAARAWMAWNWPVERFLLVSPWLSYGMVAALFGLTWRMRRQARARAG